MMVFTRRYARNRDRKEADSLYLQSAVIDPTNVQCGGTRFALAEGPLLIQNGKGNAERRRWKLTVGDAVSNDLNSKALSVTDRFVPGRALAHYAVQFQGLRDPAPIVFPIEFDR